MRRLVLFLFGLGFPAMALYYARFIEPERVEVTQTTLVLPRLTPAFDGYRIAQISDIHIDQWMDDRHLLDIVHMVNEQKPDLIVMTGDFVTYNVRYSVDDLVGPLSQLKAPDGVLAIPGNHDYWQPGGINKLRQIMRDCGMVDLSNNYYTLKRDEEVLHFAGVDSVAAKQARLDLVLNSLPATGAAVLLAHEPDFADISSATQRFDLQLSGHTHGGQVSVPFLTKYFAPLHGRRYQAGLYDVNYMWLYVNRGLGTVTVPIRFRSRPEISLVTLKAPKHKVR